MLIDVHTHLQSKVFEKDRDEVVKRTLAGEVFCIQVGTKKETSEAAVRLAERYNGFWASVGQHPTDSSESFDEKFYEQLAQNSNVVAIGECGLDYYRTDPESRDRQKEIFRAHIQLAKKIKKKLMLHCRPSQLPDKSYSTDAYEDLIEILKVEGGDAASGNVHFFVGPWDIAQKFLEMGFSFSFSGVITITSMYDEVVKKIPLDKILIETDAPYAAPMPYRGKRNEPLYVVEIAKRIAQLRDISFEEVSKLTTQNAKRVFGLEF
ncbi:TatD family hydrolase [Patescibacteria group bacterium]|nr:TatD family hydrolase [Patescibacteria group bacterium]